MTFETTSISGNEVRLPDPTPGQVTVIRRYGKERAMLIHPADFHRINDFDQLLTDVSGLKAITLSPDAVRAHREEDTPGQPIVDPVMLAEIFD